MGRKLFGGWIALTLSILLLGALGAKARHSKDIETVREIPDFTMTSAAMKAQSIIGKKDLLGRPWIASFIFAHCSGPCPLITQRMAELEKTLPDGIWMVTFTVDPARDTPDVLRRYAKKFNADPKRWLFLTGKKEMLYKVMYEGFNLPITEDRSAPSGFRVIHSTKLVLVDAKGILKGYYSSENTSSLEKLHKDTIELLKEGS